MQVNRSASDRLTPFRRDRPIIFASVAVAVLLSGVLAMLVYLAMAERDRSAASRATLQRLDGQLKSIATEETRLQAVLRLYRLDGIEGLRLMEALRVLTRIEVLEATDGMKAAGALARERRLFQGMWAALNLRAGA